MNVPTTIPPPKKLGLSFDEWLASMTRKVTDLNMEILASETELRRLWSESKSTGWVVTQCCGPKGTTVQAQQSAVVARWAQGFGSDQSVPTTSVVSMPVGIHTNPVFTNSNGSQQRQVASVRSTTLSTHTPLEERLTNPKCSLDDKIRFAWETVRIKRGELGYAEYYGSDANYTSEHERVTEEIAFLTSYLDRLKHTHEHNASIQETLADELLEAEATHKELCSEREAKKQAIEDARLLRSCKQPKAANGVPVSKPRVLTRDEVLKKYNITLVMLESMKATGVDPELLLKHMMGVA